MKEMFFNWLSGLGVDVTPMMALVIALGFIVLTAMVLHLVLHRILLVRLVGLLGKTKQMWLPPQLQQRLFYRLAFVFQGAVLLGQAEIWLPKASESLALIELLAQLWILLFLLLALFALLDCLLSLSRHTRLGRDLPLRGIFQGVKLVASILVGILMIALLLGKSPLFLFSGLGAMTAVLMLVFKDPILGLVAGIQLSANRMLSVGDWLQMDKYGADGDVIDIALHTVKVQNWDKTITNIPTKRLISDSFRNWRGMTESGGRRIKRSIFLDQQSVRFLSLDEAQSLSRFDVLTEYLTAKELELDEWNARAPGSERDVVNRRRVTNVGIFRMYVERYLRRQSGIHQGMTLMVRQLDPTSDGLPMEVYCFTNTTEWVAYEGIQSDIFDHLLAILPEFGLRVFQHPSGADLRSIVNATPAPQPQPAPVSMPQA